MRRTRAVPRGAVTPLQQATAQSAVWDAAARCAAERGVRVSDTLSRAADPSKAYVDDYDAFSAVTVHRGAPAARHDWFLPRYVTSSTHAVCVLRRGRDALAFVRDDSCTRVAVWWHGAGTHSTDARQDALRDAAFLTGVLQARNAPGNPVTCVCVLRVPDGDADVEWRAAQAVLFPTPAPPDAPAPEDAGRCAVILPRGDDSAPRYVPRGSGARSDWVHAVLRDVVPADAAAAPLGEVLPPTACRMPLFTPRGEALSVDAASAVAAAFVRDAPHTQWSDVLRALGVDAIAFLSASTPCTPSAAPPLTPWLAPRDVMVHSMHAALAHAPRAVQDRVCIIDAQQARAPHLPRCAWVQAPSAPRDGPRASVGASSAAPATAAGAAAPHDSHRNVPPSTRASPYAAVNPDVPHCTPLYGSAARRACLLFLLRHGSSMRDAVLHFGS
uniref:Uncharacterized protein n=1 Tax=viral metagenome TaxID=1070528 RepID=A0A6C0AUL1_9ZZZZ